MFFRGFGSGFSACSAWGRPAACSCLSLVGLSGHEGVLAAVGSALETDEPAVVDGAVDERGGHVLVAQDAAPSAELDVGGVDDAPCLVGIGYDLEQEPAAFLVCVLMLLYIVKRLGVLFWVGCRVYPLDGPLLEFGKVACAAFDLADAARGHAERLADLLLGDVPADA